MTWKFHKARSGERGAVLVTGLIVLLVMTILGVASMQTTVLEEKMAGNLRDQNIAFQAAEAGLQLALTHLESQKTAPFPDDDGNGVWQGCGVAADECIVRGDESWLLDHGIEYGDNRLLGGVAELAGVSRQPLIGIEDRYAKPVQGDKAEKGADVHYYTISSLGFGVSAQTRALLTTTIAKIYAW